MAKKSSKSRFPRLAGTDLLSGLVAKVYFLQGEYGMPDPGFIPDVVFRAVIEELSQRPEWEADLVPIIDCRSHQEFPVASWGVGFHHSINYPAPGWMLVGEDTARRILRERRSEYGLPAMHRLDALARAFVETWQAVERHWEESAKPQPAMVVTE